MVVYIPKFDKGMAVSPSDIAHCCYDNDTGTVVNKFSFKEGSISEPVEYRCDACTFCDDVCERATPNPLYEVCSSCNMKLKRQSNSKSKTAKYTSCQIARHDTVGDCWVVMGKDILDASPIIIEHPGGIKSILRRAGTNTDTTKDFTMHSPAAKKRWKSLRIGTLAHCPKYGAEESASNCKVS